MGEHRLVSGQVSYVLIMDVNKVPRPIPYKDVNTALGATSYLDRDGVRNAGQGRWWFCQGRQLMCGLHPDHPSLSAAPSSARIFYGSDNESPSHWKSNLRGNCSKDNEPLSHVMLK